VLQARSWLPRAEGSVRLAFAQAGGRTALAGLHQAGAARVRFPKPVAGEAPEAVLLNTAGGLTGGDLIDIKVTLAPGCEATVTSAASEKIYRTLGEPTKIKVDLHLGEGAACCWLPQPTILFDRSSLDRRTSVHMASSARLLAVEMLVYGRMAMGEHVRRGAIRDAWRVKRDGWMAFADTTRASGAIADMLGRSALLDGARAAAMVLYVAPDAEARLGEVRALLDGAADTAGASTWNGILLVRGAAPNGRDLQRGLRPVIECLSARPLPRVWQC
jgi:urease accessory protein